MQRVAMEGFNQLPNRYVLFAFRIPKVQFATPELTQDHMVRDMLVTDNTQRHRACVRYQSRKRQSLVFNCLTLHWYSSACVCCDS